MNRLLALTQDSVVTRLGVEALAAELEETQDGDLEAMLAERSGSELELLVLAAYKLGRPFDVALVAPAFPEFADPGSLIRTVRATRGNHVEELMGSVESGRLSWEREALSLFLCAHLLGDNAACHQEPPRRLVGLLRTLSRQGLTFIPGVMVGAASARLADEHLNQVAAKWITLSRSYDGEALVLGLRRALTEDPVGSLPATQTRVTSGFTVRRSVEKLGRNDPCHCGSGKKYKKCCLSADEERLKDPSPVEGLTMAELKADPLPHLRPNELRDLPAREQAKLDFSQLPTPTLVDFLRRFSVHHMWADAERVLETLDQRDDFFQDHRFEYATDLLRTGELELAASQLKRLRELEQEVPADLELELDMAKEPPGCLLARLNQMALKGLKDEQEDHLITLAFLLLYQFPGLGIPFARGVLSAARYLDSYTLTDLIEDVRDRLDLPPGDRALEIFESQLEGKLERAQEQASREGYEKLAAETQDLRQRLSQSAQRVAEFSQQLEEKEKELASRLATVPVETSAQSGAPDPEVGRLREKVRQLKSLIDEGNRERRELRESVKEMSATASAPSREEPSEPAEEQEGELDDSFSSWPVLLPRFSSQAESDFRRAESSTSRRALARLGEICAGDPGALGQVKKLHLRPAWRSARVGRSHRLLFEPRTDEGILEVLALIQRRDLERTLAR
jgi:hypothetical protein